MHFQKSVGVVQVRDVRVQKGNVNQVLVLYTFSFFALALFCLLSETTVLIVCDISKMFKHTLAARCCFFCAIKMHKNLKQFVQKVVLKAIKKLHAFRYLL